MWEARATPERKKEFGSKSTHPFWKFMRAPVDCRRSRLSYGRPRPVQRLSESPVRRSPSREVPLLPWREVEIWSPGVRCDEDVIDASPCRQSR